MSMIIFLALTADYSVKGQSAFLEEGQGGIAVGAIAGTNRESYILGGGVGFSINGRLDIRLAFAVITLPEYHLVINRYHYVSDIGRSATTFGPAFEYHVIKDNTLFPLSFAPGFSLTSVSFDNTSALGFALFNNFYRNVYFTDNLIFQPAYRPAFHYSQTDAAGGNMIDRTWSHSISLGIGFKVSDDLLLVVSPSASITAQITTWGIEIASIF